MNISVKKWIEDHSFELDDQGACIDVADLLKLLETHEIVAKKKDENDENETSHIDDGLYHCDTHGVVKKMFSEIRGGVEYTTFTTLEECEDDRTEFELKPGEFTKAEHTAETHTVSLSMDGFRSNLVDEMNELHEALSDIFDEISDEDKEEISDKYNAVACSVNFLNCISYDGIEKFSNRENEPEASLFD